MVDDAPEERSRAQGAEFYGKSRRHASEWALPIDWLIGELTGRGDRRTNHQHVPQVITLTLERRLRHCNSASCPPSHPSSPRRPPSPSPSFPPLFLQSQVDQSRFIKAVRTAEHEFETKRHVRDSDGTSLMLISVVQAVLGESWCGVILVTQRTALLDRMCCAVMWHVSTQQCNLS